MTSSVAAAENDVTSGHVTSSEGSSRTNVSRQPVTHYNTFHGPFFWTTRSPRRQYFIIHPEWASENIVPATWLSSAVEQQRQQTGPRTPPPPRTGRRCHSAPPGTRSRNPITWENWSP